ncbi:hypothetical protein R0G64_32395, partial [Pseudomonas otitidis]|nr:hypothetical protein [Pseudomonas otitidis]
MIVRPVRSADLPALIDLARSTGAGHGGDADDLAIVVLEHEQVVGIGPLGLATECLLGP